MKHGKRLHAEIVQVVLLVGLLFATYARLRVQADTDRSIAEIFMLLCIMLDLFFAVYLIWDKCSRKSVLLDMSIGALDEFFPRAVRVNYRTGECILLKDKKQAAGTILKKYDWNKYRGELLEGIHPEDVEKYRTFTSAENMRRMCEQEGESDTCTYRCLRDGEYQWMQTFMIPVNTRKKRRYVLLYTKNADDSVKAEELYKEQLWKALQQSKTEEADKARFIEYLAQDLRTSMSDMTCACELAEKNIELGDVERAREYVKCLGNMGRYVQTMLNDIIQVGILREKQIISSRNVFSLQDMLDVCRQSNMEIRGQKREIAFRVAVDERLKPRYTGDAVRLIRVLNSLVSNAYKFNHKAGNVKLTARLVEAGETSDRVAFLVCDGGNGISEEFKPMLFDLFAKEKQTSERAEEGVGLGLCFAKMAIESMGGEIRVESRLGEGSCFTVEVNLEHADETGLLEEVKKPCVLAVDDNELNLEIAAEILEHGGYRHVQFESGKAALKAFEESEPGTFDIVLTDIKMPEMDGYELAEKIRSSSHPDGRKIPVVVISGNIDREEIKKHGRMDGFLEKPFKIEEFNEIVYQKRGNV